MEYKQRKDSNKLQKKYEICNSIVDILKMIILFKLLHHACQGVNIFRGILPMTIFQSSHQILTEIFFKKVPKITKKSSINIFYLTFRRLSHAFGLSLEVEHFWKNNITPYQRISYFLTTAKIQTLEKEDSQCSHGQVRIQGS